MFLYFNRIEAEDEVIRCNLRQKFLEAFEYYGRQPFAQALHDGGTLKNQTKYQAIGLQFIPPNWEQNIVVAIGFEAVKDSKASTMVALIESCLKKFLGIDQKEEIRMHDYCHCISQDGAALYIAKSLGYEAEVPIE